MAIELSPAGKNEAPSAGAIAKTARTRSSRYESPERRSEAIARSKVCLALRQNETWGSPSIARIHYHLMAKSYLLAEKCEEASELDDYIEIVEPEYFTEVCIETVVRGGTARLGELQHQRFREGTNVTVAVSAMLAASLGEEVRQSVRAFT